MRLEDALRVDDVLLHDVVGEWDQSGRSVHAVSDDSSLTREVCRRRAREVLLGSSLRELDIYVTQESHVT